MTKNKAGMDKKKRVLVVSPHPDDESIGCGGSLRKHVVEGDLVRVIFLTSGEKGGHGRPREQTRRLREGEARAAARVLGIREIEFWGQADGALRATRPLIQRLGKEIAVWRPDWVYVTHDREMAADHRAAARLVRLALAEAVVRDKPCVRMFEVWTPIERIDEIVDISPFMGVKLKAVRAHRSQCAEVGFVPAVRGLNRYRGEMHSWPGGDYAEIFKNLRP